MYISRKLRPESITVGLALPLGILITSGAVGVFIDLALGFYTCAAFILFVALYYLLVFLRTKNPYILIQTLYITSISLLAASMAAKVTGSVRTGVPQFILVVLFVLMAATIYLAVTRQIKWRGREVLELAAEEIEETGDGFTARPRPTGKTAYTRQELKAFARFLARYQIALSFIEKERVVFVPVLSGREYGFILGTRHDYRDDTWISFTYTGEVSVNFSEKDYLLYKEDLAFDPLCASLGDLFIEFMDLFRRGRHMRIIDRMNELGLPYFS